MQSERDTHFQHAAHFLVQEMRKRGFIADDTALQDEEMQTLIAQHDYDLACYVLAGVGERTGALLEVEYLTPEQFVNESVPDLTSWPEQT